MNEYGSTSEEMRRKGIAVTLLSSLLLGSSYVVIKAGLTDLDPFLFATLVFGIGAGIALTVTLIRRTFTWSIFRTWEAWAAPLITFVLVACQYSGLALTNASTGALIIGANVLIVAPLSAFFFKERLGGLRLAGLALGMVGLLMLTTGLDPSSLEGGEVIGDILVFIATVCIALTYLISRSALQKMTFDQWVLTIHLLTPLPLLMLYLTVGDKAPIEDGALPFVLYIGVFCTAVPTLMWIWGLKRIGMVNSSVIILSESAFAVVLSVLLLNEELAASMVVGAAMVFLAIFMVVRGEGASHRRCSD